MLEIGFSPILRKNTVNAFLSMMRENFKSRFGVVLKTFSFRMVHKKIFKFF